MYRRIDLNSSALNMYRERREQCAAGHTRWEKMAGAEGEKEVFRK